MQVLDINGLGLFWEKIKLYIQKNGGKIDNIKVEGHDSLPIESKTVTIPKAESTPLVDYVLGQERSGSSVVVRPDIVVETEELSDSLNPIATRLVKKHIEQIRDEIGFLANSDTDGKTIIDKLNAIQQQLNALSNKVDTIEQSYLTVDDIVYAQFNADDLK